MSCSILTPVRLEALLAGKLGANDRAALELHFQSPCETCLDRLGSVEGERILAALAGPGADLSAAEADQLFDRAVPAPNPAARAGAKPGFIEKLVEWLGGATWRPAIGLAALLLVVVPVALLSPEGHAPRGGYDGIKGGPGPAAPVKANLVGVVGGKFHGKPFIARRAAMREQLRPGEILLVKFRIESSAAIHLQIAGPKASLGVWPDGRADTEPQAPMLPAGEHALVADKQILSVQTQEYGSPVRVTLVASPRPFPAGFSFSRIGNDPRVLAAVCPDCTLDVLEVLPPPEGVEPEESFR